jgi:ribosomal protein S18 acetylase RimI-like enzyme
LRGKVAVVSLPAGVMIREARGDDLAYIVHTWMKNFAMTAWAREAGPLFQTEHRALVKRLLGRCETRVAVSAEDSSAILGFCCVEESLPAPVVHYCYVRKEARRSGIARALIGSAASAPLIEYTSKPSMDWRGPKHPWVFNPYRLA